MKNNAEVLLTSGYNRIKLTRHGYMLYNAHDAYVGCSLDTYGEFSEEEVACILSFLNPDSVVMDIGANYGALTVPMARRARLAYAFEPQRPVFYAMVANLALNCLDNVMCENMALADRPGFITVPRLDFAATNNIGGLAIGHPGTSGHGSYSVRADTLDDYVERNRIRRLDFIKVDVEGMEESVLRGGEKSIRALRPILYVEADRREKLPSLRAFLADLGYACEEHAPPLFNPANFFGHPRNVWDRNIISMNLLCRPGP